MTERAKKLLLLYYKQSRKIRRVSGLPPLTFKAKKAGNLKNYRIYGNTETLTRSYSGSAPHSFPIEDGSVSNYRIYGNTVNGESAGELVTDSQSEHYGKYAIPITNNSENTIIYLDEPLRKVGDEAEYVDYATQKRYNADGTNEDVTLPALPAQSSTNSLSVGTTIQPSSVAVDVAEVVSCGDRTENLFNINDLSNGSISVADGVSIISNNQKHTETYIPVNGSQSYTLTVRATLRVHQYSSDYSYLGSTLELGTFITNANAAFIRLAGTKEIFTDIVMLNMGSTALPYEPYGYKIPVTLTAGIAETTDIYLDTPLAKSGNSADYIDYATQKRRNSDGTESSVTLPEIAVTAGTNTLTVGTEVQPSGVEIKGRIKAAGGD